MEPAAQGLRSHVAWLPSLALFIVLSYKIGVRIVLPSQGC